MRIVNGFKLVTSKVNAIDMETLKSIGDTLRSKIGSGVGLLASVIDDKVALVCVVSDDLIKTRNIAGGKDCRRRRKDRRRRRRRKTASRNGRRQRCIKARRSVEKRGGDCGGMMVRSEKLKVKN